MGLLRLYLALCVLASHSDKIVPWTLHGGREAVQIFFIISGFYMALVFHKYRSIPEFYMSRFLRIYIPYWSIALIIILLCVIGGVTVGNWGRLAVYSDIAEKNGLAGVAFTLFTNIVIFFQDAVWFLSHDLGEPLRFTHDFWSSQHALRQYLIISQAWSVAIELMFYLCLPLLIRLSNKKLLLLIIVSLSLRIYFYEVIEWAGDPWSYRFFPFEIALFSLGIFSCRIWNKYEPLLSAHFKKFASSAVKFYLPVIPCLLLLFYLNALGTRMLAHYISMNYAVLVSYLMWMIILPVLFTLSKNNTKDRYIGELSYPLYLLHLFIIFLVRTSLTVFNASHLKSCVGIFSAIISILASIVIIRLIITPLDRIRYSLAQRLADRLKRRIP